MLFNDKILTRESWNQILSNSVKIGRFRAWNQSPLGSLAIRDLRYGYGWAIANYKGKNLLTHGGSTLGFTTEYLKFIESKTSIIILSNTYRRRLASISEKIYEAVEHIK